MGDVKYMNDYNNKKGMEEEVLAFKGNLDAFKRIMPNLKYLVIPEKDFTIIKTNIRIIDSNGSLPKLNIVIRGKGDIKFYIGDPIDNNIIDKEHTLKDIIYSHSLLA